MHLPDKAQGKRERRQSPDAVFHGGDIVGNFAEVVGTPVNRGPGLGRQQFAQRRLGALNAAGQNRFARHKRADQQMRVWQTVAFAKPVHITAGTTYVASYHMNTGHYAYTYNGLTSTVDSPPLHALASSSASGNGVFVYSAVSTFPTGSSKATNYWVDLTFVSG